MNTGTQCAALVLVACGVLGACGGSDEKSSSPGAATDGGTGGGTGNAGATGAGGAAKEAGAGTGGSGTGGGTGACDLAPCTGKSFMGVQLTACCQTSGGCGITFGAAGGQCLPPSVLNNLGEGGGPLGQSEPIVPDAKCASTTFTLPAAFGGDGGPITLDGCCDKSGFCGSSTENFPSIMGFSIPTQCVTTQELGRAGGGAGPMQDAGPPVACDYPAGGG